MLPGPWARSIVGCGKAGSYSPVAAARRGGKASYKPVQDRQEKRVARLLKPHYVGSKDERVRDAERRLRRTQRTRQVEVHQGKRWNTRLAANQGPSIALVWRGRPADLASEDLLPQD